MSSNCVITSMLMLLTMLPKPAKQQQQKKPTAFSQSNTDISFQLSFGYSAYLAIICSPLLHIVRLTAGDKSQGFSCPN